MRGSWKLGEVAGIGIFVHWTFLILIGWIVVAHVVQRASLNMLLMGLATVLAIFGCIVLHELGHALTARRYGIQTRDITLLPIGGLARLERMPEEPLQELWVALAGPAVNVVISVVLFVLLAVFGTVSAMTDFEPIGGHFLGNLLWINLFLAVFNLLPAFPMDGGRVLRALLAWRSGDYVSATQTAASVGQFMAILFGFVGLFWNPFLVFIALFVYLGAQEEAYSAQVRAAFRGLPVRDAMMTRFRVLNPQDTLGRAVDELLAGSQQDFPIVDNGRVTGVLLRNQLMKGLTELGREASISDVLVNNCGTVSDSEMLQATFDRMRSDQCPTLPVTRNGELVGLVTLENVGELMLIQSALGQTKPRSAMENIFAGR